MRPRAAALIVFFIGCWNFISADLGSAQENGEKDKHFEKADIELFCYKWNEIYVTIGDVDEQFKHWPGVSRERIKDALKDTEPKNRIDIWLGKGLWNSPSEADKVKAFEDYAVSLGCQELLMYDSTGSILINHHFLPLSRAGA
jgi:hypothetical protein